MPSECVVSKEGPSQSPAVGEMAASCDGHRLRHGRKKVVIKRVGGRVGVILKQMIMLQFNPQRVVPRLIS